MHLLVCLNQSSGKRLGVVEYCITNVEIILLYVKMGCL